MLSLLSAAMNALRKQWETVGFMAILLSVLLVLCINVQAHVELSFLNDFQRNMVLSLLVIGAITRTVVYLVWKVTKVVCQDVWEHIQLSHDEWQKQRVKMRAAVQKAMNQP